MPSMIPKTLRLRSDIEGSLDNPGRHSLSSYLDLNLLAQIAVRHWNVSQADVLFEVRRGTSTGEDASLLSVDENRVAIAANSFANHLEPNELFLDTLALLLHQCFLADKITLIQLDDPGQVGFPGRRL